MGELKAGAVLKPSQGKVIWDGTKCFPVALCLKCCDWANCLEFGILSLENEDRALLSCSIFQLMFLRHFTDILFPSIKVLSSAFAVFKCIAVKETECRGIKMTSFKLAT